MISSNVTIIDYGIGNLLSVKRGLEKCGAQVTISSNSDEILSSERIILPGVGAFSKAMEELKNKDLIEIIKNSSKRGTPILGICLGMQMLLDESEEFGISEGMRTKERQKILYDTGKSQTMNSRHLTGHAVDVYAWKDGAVSWEFEDYETINIAFSQAAKLTNIESYNCGETREPN